MCVWVTTGYKEEGGGGRRCACVCGRLWVTKKTVGEGGGHVCVWRGDVGETEMCEKFSHAHLLGFDACFS